MMTKYFVVSTFLVSLTLIASGCGGGKGGDAQNPLTDAQKSTVKSTVSNVSSITSTATSSASTTPNASASSTPGSPNVMKDAQNIQDPSDAAQTQQMVSMLSKGACSFQINAGSQDPNVSSTASLKVSGSACPISLDYEVQGTVANSQMSMQFVMEYSVLNDSFKKLNDVDHVSVRGPMTSDMTTGAFSANLSGNIHSQANGSITFSMIGQSDLANNRAGLTVKYVYPSFTAVLIVTGSPSGSDATYTINGQTISEAEFYSYMAFSASPSAASSTSSSN